MIKKLIYISILIILCGNFALAKTQSGGLEYNSYKYTFKSGDEQKFLKQANVDMLLFEKSELITQKAYYLQDAMRYFYMVSQINPKSVDAQVGLARIYDEIQLDNYAKKHFYVGLDFDNKNPKTNFYFANFYYKRKDLINALTYYKKAYEYGYSNNVEVNYMMGTIYEKLADIENSKKFYANALALNPTNEELNIKIRLLDELNYSQSQYYLYSNSGKRKKRDK